MMNVAVIKIINELEKNGYKTTIDGRGCSDLRRYAVDINISWAG